MPFRRGATVQSRRAPSRPRRRSRARARRRRSCARASSPRAKRSKIRSSASGAIPTPRPRPRSRARSRGRTTRSSIAPPGSVYLTAFSSSASSASRSASSSARSVRPRVARAARRAGATSAQRTKTSSRNASASISARREELRLSGLREQEQPRDDPLHARELVDRDCELRAVAGLPAQQVEVAARNRHRRAQLVRDVVEEALLLLDERLGLAHRRLPAPRMPHHREEHRRHQRHLEQLAPELDPLEGVGEDRPACRR